MSEVDKVVVKIATATSSNKGTFDDDVSCDSDAYPDLKLLDPTEVDFGNIQEVKDLVFEIFLGLHPEVAMDIPMSLNPSLDELQQAQIWVDGHKQYIRDYKPKPKDPQVEVVRGKLMDFKNRKREERADALRIKDQDMAEKFADKEVDDAIENGTASLDDDEVIRRVIEQQEE